MRQHSVQTVKTGEHILVFECQRCGRLGNLTRGARDPGLAADGWFTIPHMAYPYGAQLALVKIDGGTGTVAVERILIAFDVGRAINPMLVRGQFVGGFAQGLGGALFEEFKYDERGQPLSVTFADYLMPTAHEMPPIDVMVLEEAPSICNPLASRGQVKVV
jgi:carbon-monoxide dehydrogenase large subunit